LHAVAEMAVHREALDAAAVQIAVPEELRVKADRQLLIRALGNLVRNALRYAGECGPVIVSARKEGCEGCLSVIDCGPGVPEEHLPKLFDPFYRVDASRDRSTGGAGLGLTIVKTCIEACRGTVVCQNRLPKGFEVSIRLPLA
jgi:two-component system sensor histidine kinase CpxA